MTGGENLCPCNLLRVFIVGHDKCSSIWKGCHSSKADLSGFGLFKPVSLFFEPEEVSTDQRRSAKAINFGLIYGMSAFGLARQIKVDRKTAQGYIDRYFERYPGVLGYMDRVRKQAHDDEYVETIFGRRLYLPEINASNKMRQQAAERTAINAPMQGTAADIIKKAMINVAQWLAESGLDARMIMQVHDELVLEVREDLVEQVTATLLEKMESAASLDVPLLVEAGVGNNWDEAH